MTPAAGNFMRIDPVVDDRDGAGPPPTQSFDWAGLTGNYNQTINGHHYALQQEWSNASSGCALHS